MGKIDDLIQRMDTYFQAKNVRLIVVSGVAPAPLKLGRNRKDRPDEAAIRLARGIGIVTVTSGHTWKAWQEMGKVGSERNAWLIERIDALVAFWDGESTGTVDAIDQAIRWGLKVTVYGSNGQKMDDRDLDSSLRHNVLMRGRPAFT